MNRSWDQLSLGERIVQVAWMAVREHLGAQACEDACEDDRSDQASRLRELVRGDRFKSVRPIDGGRE